MAGAVKLILDFGIRAPFLDDLVGNAALCGDELGLGVLLGGRCLALSPLKVCLEGEKVAVERAGRPRNAGTIRSGWAAGQELSRRAGQRADPRCNHK